MIRRGAWIPSGAARGCRDSAMSQPAKAQEPSMEEILASIRRIIADDETAKPRVRSQPPPRPHRRRVPSRCRRASGAAIASGGRAAPVPAAVISDEIDAMMARPRAPARDAAPGRRCSRPDRADGGAGARTRRRASRPSTGSPTWSSPIRRAQPEPRSRRACRGAARGGAAAAAPQPA